MIKYLFATLTGTTLYLSTPAVELLKILLPPHSRVPGNDLIVTDYRAEKLSLCMTMTASKNGENTCARGAWEVFFFFGSMGTEYFVDAAKELCQDKEYCISDRHFFGPLFCNVTVLFARLHRALGKKRACKMAGMKFLSLLLASAGLAQGKYIVPGARVSETLVTIINTTTTTTTTTNLIP